MNTIKSSKESYMKYYSFELLPNILEGYNVFKNKLQEKKVEPYPWLEPDDPRRKLTDRQVIESMINLSQSCLSKEKQEEVHNLLVKYRDEIGTCLNIEADFQVKINHHFSLDHFCKRKDRAMIDKEMQKLVHLGMFGEVHYADCLK